MANLVSSSIDKAFDDIFLSEERFYQIGYNEGRSTGLIEGQIKGNEDGYYKGKYLGQEVGEYYGTLNAIMIMDKNIQHKKFKMIQHLLLLIRKALSIKQDMFENEISLEDIRLKYNQITKILLISPKENDKKIVLTENVQPTICKAGYNFQKSCDLSF